jgi:hypothetical protein
VCCFISRSCRRTCHSTGSDAETDAARAYDAGIIEGGPHPINDSRVIRNWNTATADKAHRAVNVFHSAKLFADELPPLNLLMGADDLQKKVPIDDASIVVMEAVTFDHVKSIISPDHHSMQGLREQFPATNGLFFAGIVEVNGRQGASLYRWSPSTGGKHTGRPKVKAHYARIGHLFSSNKKVHDISMGEGELMVTNFATNKGNDHQRRSRGIKVACKGISTMRVHRLLCTVFNGPPITWDLTVDHLGPRDWNHPHLLRFCTLGYNQLACRGWNFGNRLAYTEQIEWKALFDSSSDSESDDDSETSHATRASKRSSDSIDSADEYRVSKEARLSKPRGPRKTYQESYHSSDEW